MYYSWVGSSFFGMYGLWWIFWIVMLFVVFGWATPVRRKTMQILRETPLAMLQRRYASGEITTEQYEERKRILERDRPDPVNDRTLRMDTHVPQPR